MGKDMSNTRNLRRRRGGGWAAVVYVPASLQKKLGGRKEIVRGLGTRNLREANERKWAVIADIQQDLEKLRNPRVALLKEATLIAENFDPDDEMLDKVSLKLHTISRTATARSLTSSITRQPLADGYQYPPHSICG